MVHCHTDSPSSIGSGQRGREYVCVCVCECVRVRVRVFVRVCVCVCVRLVVSTVQSLVRFVSSSGISERMYREVSALGDTIVSRATWCIWLLFH